MKTNTILIFFIFLAILFWNPISYYVLYSSTSIYDSRVVKIIFWFVFILCVLCIFLVNKRQINKIWVNIIFAFSFTSLIFGFVVLVNVLFGLLIPNSKSDELDKEKGESKGVGLIFEPNSKASYKTSEFDFIATINSFGLRDDELNIDKGSNYRVMCFGDSWTFGWGVELENSWPKKLERFLQEKGIRNIEVINCGRGGQYTRTYAEYMEKAIPLLKPDLVLVGISQIDDLAQLYENNLAISNPAAKLGFSEMINLVTKNFLISSTSNIVKLIGNITQPQLVEVKSNWETSSLELINSFNHFQRIRFNALDDTVQTMFKTGNLNPGLLNNYIGFPERITIFNNPSHKSTQFAIDEMDKDLKAMLEICSQNEVKLVFVNMPIDVFTGHTVIKTPSDVLNHYFMENNKIDSIYQSLALRNNLPYIELTRHFKDFQEKDKYFFKYDGHPNEKGYEEIGKFVGNHLIENNIITINK